MPSNKRAILIEVEDAAQAAQLQAHLASGGFGAGRLLDATDAEFSNDYDTLLDSNKRFESLVNMMPQPVWETDLEMRFTYINQAGKDCFRVSETDIENGLTVHDIMTPESMVKAQRNFALRMQGEEVPGHRYLCRRLDGTTMHTLIYGAPIIDSGKPVGIRGITIDIDEQIRLEEMLVQSEKMMSVGELAAGMAHELNNPLGGILQTVGVMNDRLLNTSLPANQKVAVMGGVSLDGVTTYMEQRKIPEMLDRIRRSGQQAASIVANMLSFARMSRADTVCVPIHDVLEKSIALLRANYNNQNELDFRRIEIVRAYDTDFASVYCDPVKMQQVFFNILRNGAESMALVPDRPARFNLRLGKDPHGDGIRVEIEDNGTGMDAEMRKRVFEPFFTTKSPDGGSGLGLSISYFIVTKCHNGSIYVESERDEFSRFVICLPRVCENADCAIHK